MLLCGRHSRCCKGWGAQAAAAAAAGVVRCRVCCRRPGCAIGVEHAGAVQYLRHHPRLALAQRPADVHAHSVAHVALVGLVMGLHRAEA